ncbi:asparagine--tRNA ligase, partial [Coemansia sp. RSA 1933]
AAGCDESGSGTQSKPFKTGVAAVAAISGMPEEKQPTFKIQIKKAGDEKYSELTASALKKAKKAHEVAQKKAKKQAEQAANDQSASAAKQEEEQRRLEESKSIVLVEDPALPAAEAITIASSVEKRNRRVKVSGWVSSMRVQGKGMIFVVLRDGTGYLQCVLTGRLCHTYDAVTLAQESTVAMYGQIKV